MDDVEDTEFERRLFLGETEEEDDGKTRTSFVDSFGSYKKVEPRAATPDPRTELRDVGQSANALSKPSLETAYFSFFLMRSWFVCPHFFLRQFTARAWRRA